MTVKRLFEAVNNVSHNYTWENTVTEGVLVLYDLDKDHFALTTLRREIDDETGAMGDYRNNCKVIFRLFSKGSLEVIEFYEPSWGEQISAEIEVVREQGWGENPKETNEIVLPAGRVYIDGGSLVCDLV